MILAARPFRAIAVLALASLLSACSRPRGESSATAAQLRLGYYANLTHAQAVLGVASGDFARAIAPTNLETKIFNAGPSLIEALFAGEIDVGYVGPGPVLSAHARSHGQGLRVVGGAAANGVVIVARNGSGVRSLQDLAGRRVATPQLGNTQDISARHYLMNVLGQSDLNNVVPVDNSQQAGLFERGAVDAAWVPEPWGEVLVAQAGASLIGEEKDLWPGKEFALTLVIATPAFLANHRDLVERLLSAHRRWTARLQKEPLTHAPALGDALFALTGKRLPAAVVSAALGRVAFTDDPHEDTMRTYAAWSHDLGFEPAAVDVHGLVDGTIAAKLEAAGQ
jgi:NitT/TauT family transport system substrate-binding protein